MNTGRQLMIPRRGRVVLANGELVEIKRRWLAFAGSSVQIWLDARIRPLSQDRCCLYYTATRNSPGYLTLDYIRSGPRTSLRTFRGALLVLDEIARLRGAVAIFAHVGTTAISDRLLRRWGWEPHAKMLSGRHWVKRFYDGYPQHNLSHLGISTDNYPLDEGKQPL